MSIQTLLDSTRDLTGYHNCDYLVFKIDGRNVSTDFTEVERIRIYETLTILPFPGNTNPLYAERIAQLTTDLPFSLDIQERLVIEAVLKKINPNLRLLPIPKSLLQFYTYMTTQSATVGDHAARAAQAFVNFKNATIDRYTLRRDANIHMAERCRAGRHSVFELLEDQALQLSGPSATRFAKANIAAGLDQLWCAVNACLIKEVVTAAAQHNDLRETYSTFAQKWPLQFQTAYEAGARFTARSLPPNLPNSITQLFMLEINIVFSKQYTNQCVLYRGCRGIEDDLSYLASKPKHSFSYGNGLCEGMVQDPDACALVYIMHRYGVRDNNGIAVFVNTANYRNDRAERMLFWIPPLNSPTRVFSIGETFHARTAGVGTSGNNSLMGERSFFDRQGPYGEIYMYPNSMVSKAMFNLVRERRVHTELTSYMAGHCILISDVRNPGLVPDFSALRLTANQMREFLQAFFAINAFNKNALDQTNRSLHTPLTKAVDEKSLSTVKELVWAGASLAAKNGLGNTALHIPAMWLNEPIARFLLEVACAYNIDLAIPDANGKTPFDIARANGFTYLMQNEQVTDPHVLNFLRKHGFSTLRSRLDQTQDRDQLFTPLLKAVWLQDADTAVKLYAAGASVNAHNRYGNTPAHIAAEKRDGFMFAWFKRHDADMTKRNAAQHTPDDIVRARLGLN